MDYISSGEAAARWGVSVREVQRLLGQNRIPGAKRYGNYWMIPGNSKKPADPRKARKQAGADAPSYSFLLAVDMPRKNPDAALVGADGTRRALGRADFAFRRGDPEPAKSLWRETGDGDALKLSVASLASAAAVSSGDAALYDEIRLFLQSRAEQAQSAADRALLSLPGTLVAVSMASPELTPEWLKNCDFSLFPADIRPFLLYLYVLHLRNVGDYSAMLGVVEATMLLTEKPATFTWLDVYLPVLAATAAYALGDAERAKRYLASGFSLVMSCGFIAPFADYLGSLGGMVETMVERDFPQYAKPIDECWERSFKNWMRFHNAFARDNITVILTPREYHVARLLVGGESYAGVSRRLNLSVSRVKDVQHAVYGKLHIAKRSELRPYIL